MKKIISVILVLAILTSTINITFANDAAQGNAYFLATTDINGIAKVDFINKNNDGLAPIKIVDSELVESGIPKETKLINTEKTVSESEEAFETQQSYITDDFTFNANLFTKFNTITGPVTGNGANEPKFSYNSFIEENISDYSGELTLNFEDLVLEGRNGLDLRIGRTYQSVASNIGEKTLMVLPDENGYLENNLIYNYSSYLLDRYNLGIGWGFSFPSVQVETEYIPEEVADTYYYEEKTELYYHSGNGDVYQIEFTSDTADSNLKGYYNKDIQFNQNDKVFTNGQQDEDGNPLYSYYSMTLPDKTKQYFAKDGRLMGIVDRFGNTIKFEHELSSIVNRVPEGNFKYDDGMWTSSEGSDGTHDAIQMVRDGIGRSDNYIMYFRRENENNESYIMSQPIQIKPMTEYEFGVSIKGEYGDDIKVEIFGYDTAYNLKETVTKWIKDYPTQQWHDFFDTFSMSSAVRYIVIKICPQYAEYMYIDNVRLDEPKPLISKITDSVGRTVNFTYTGDLSLGGAIGSVTVSVTSPDGENTRTLTYNKAAFEFGSEYLEHEEQRLYWYLFSSVTDGDDGSKVVYEYDGGAAKDENGDLIFPKLYMRSNTKIHSESHGWINKPVLSSVRYKDRKKIYEYETVRKHLGDDGYYDTLRIKKKYDMYSYLPEGETVGQFKGELGVVNYLYGGTYNGNSFDNETGYPNYTFDGDSALNEKWTVTKSGLTTDTTTFSNCAVVSRTSSSGDTTVTSDYTNHNAFKNSPVQIKNTVTQNGETKNSYILYSYNDWGGIATESKEVAESIKDNAELLEKYTTTYQYNPDFHFVTQKSYYNNTDGAQVHEKYTYDSVGRMVTSENAAKEKISYYYENTDYPFLVTKTVEDDPMRFHNVMGGDRIVTYSYDTYALYPTVITETYSEGNSQSGYVYDYITGDLLREILPDGSYTDYTYYSDGRTKTVVSPYTQYLDGRLFYTVEQHTYTSNAACENYNTEIPVYDAEQISRYRVFTDDSSAAIYSAEVNFYDAVGNLKMNEKYDFSKTDSDGYYLRYKTKYYHDIYDRLIKTVDDEENEVLYSYDGFGRIESATDSENNVYNYTYDAVENKVDLKLNGSGSTTQKHLMTQYYDLYGNTIKNVVYPNNTESNYLSESYEYDLNNNVISYTDANGNKTGYLYDAANRLKETLLPNGVRATANYSVFGVPAFEKIFASDGTEKSARISYRNEKGDLNMKFFNYDKRMVITNTYASDEKGRMTSISEGENPKSVIYDETNHPIVLTSGENQIHRRYNWFGEVSAASTDSDTPEIRLGYDALGNLSAKSQNGSYYMYYTYSPIGNITQSTMPSERTESYTYTANGNLDTIASDGNTFDYDYYDTGYVKSIIYPGDLKTVYEYDNINRVTKITTTKGTNTINTFEYEYDGNGNVTKEIRNGNETAYSYDSLDRLIRVVYNDSTSVLYEYDALNNRTKETYSNGDVKDYVYNSKYQLEKIKLNGQVTDTFTYNSTGAVIKHNGKTFTYDEWDRMSGYADGTNTYTYKYDANGIRTQKNDRQYIIDINNNVVAETDSAGEITDEILWGHQPLARKANGSWYYYIYNAHGDVVGLVNDAGTVVNTYEYTPWGEIRSEIETVDNPIKYAGEYYDEELDMYYLRARYYNPQIGRFTSLDIEEGDISNPLDMNRYVYCRNNPIKHVDKTGNQGIKVSTMLLGRALLGDGRSMDYSDSKEFQMTIQSSAILKNEIEKHFEVFKNSDKTIDIVSGSIGFYGNDWNTNDLDLHLAVGKANYIMIFKKETEERSFLWKTWTNVSYSVKVTISDTYDFDEYREGTSISNWLNNWGYDMQKDGKLTPYDWKITFTKGL